MARMSLFRKIAIIAAPAAALLALSGCASPFRADVARFQQLPAPQGQSFSVMADDPQLSGGLEFSQYANLVANELAEKGYVRSADPAAADLVVRRSEEHTSELQSLMRISYAVFCLKKKNTQTNT